MYKLGKCFRSWYICFWRHALLQLPAYAELDNFPFLYCRLDGSNRIPFGSTSVRTVPLTKKDVFHMPGPADYQDSKTQSPRYYNKDKLSHTFASSSKRLYSPNTVGCGVTNFPNHNPVHKIERTL